ncbi:MAG: cell surface protein SprA [Sphingobacteriaceae bacterium]
MKKTSPVFLFFFLISFVFGQQTLFAQTPVQKPDSTQLVYPFRDSKTLLFKKPAGISLPNPANVQRTVEFDPISRQYIIKEKVGNQFYRSPQYLSIEEYQRLENQQIKKNYWRELSDLAITEARQPGFIPAVKIDSKSFNRLFGGSTIEIRPQGSAELTFAGRINRNENPLFNERQRTQGNFDFNQRIQMNLVGQVGEKLRISTNYNTEAQFDFENQIKLDYTGKDDEIIKKIEAGNVSLPLSSSLITGSQALFGLKTQLQFGRLNVTTVFSQQKSQSKEITITNGSQQNEFRVLADSYEANKHYFLAQYFHDHYNEALKKLPLISTNINITKIEVWITNRASNTTDSRDVLAFVDLGENNPYNTTVFQGGAGYSVLPAGFNGPGFTKASNNLLAAIPPGARFTNTNDINSFFQASGATDNFAKLTYARKLTEKEYTLHPQLGYVSLNSALNADEVLAVAYRYTINGEEYQVGEFSTDKAVNNAQPEVLYVKLLKNETLKTKSDNPNYKVFPLWNLMMKNIYSLGAYQISKNDFRLNIFRLDEQSGVEKPQMTEGVNTNGKLWLQLTNVDNLNQQNDRKPDGFFDFLEGLTIDPLNGRITFPTIEPFGADLAAQFTLAEANLAKKYVYQPLYDLTKADAQQLYPELNRYIIKGTYQSQVSSEFQLNAINIPEGSVQVIAGTLPLQEGADFTIDYNIGRVRILNQALLNSGQPIRIKLENNELFGLQQKSLFGSRFDYRAGKKLNLGATFLNLTERPLTQKVNIGEEPISNTIWGMDLNYSSDSRWLTRMVDKIPLINTKEKSTITFTGEFANFIPGHPNSLNFAGSKNGSSYLDDFEASRSVIDLKSSVAWQISGTPQLFPESQLNDNLSYGFNRARLAWYNIDPIFYNRYGTGTPSDIKLSPNALSNHYAREVLEREVFPFKDSPSGQPLLLPTMNMAFYPSLRGPYNYTTTDIDASGNLLKPKERWGGMFRKLESNDFEALNIEFIEMWVLDPFIYKPNSQEKGYLYFNLGNISEDILKDGRKSLENGLPSDGDAAKTDATNWGKVPKLQPVIQAFDNNPDSRKLQDVGLDGLSNAQEQQFFANSFLNQLSPQAAAELSKDPSSDDYQYFRGNQYDNSIGILERYQHYNGSDGNSKTPSQSLAETGLENTASTSLPDGEDVNRDNNSSKADEYYEYKIPVSVNDLSTVGANYVTDILPATVKLANGNQETVRWIQLKIPLAEFNAKYGNIQDFKSIRFIRAFMTGFAEPTILRFAKLQLVRGEWRRYNAENNPAKVIADPSIINPIDNSSLEVSTVNIEENGKRTPIPYVTPPGIARELDYSGFNANTRQNEQSLSVKVKSLKDGFGRAAFRTSFNDFRSYRRMEMFIHAESADQVNTLNDKDVSAFIRIGSDNQDNYYEYSIPLKVSQAGTTDPSAIWPEENKLDVALNAFQLAKTARNNALYNGAPWPVNKPFQYSDGQNTITVMGQPDMSKVRVYMVGVRNPLKNMANPSGDDGLDKAAEVWFNELRLTDFDERGGWAATARMNAKLADFADVSVSGSRSTDGFGSLDKRVSERNRSNNTLFDVSSSIEAGKFFSQRSGIKIPMFVNFSQQVNTPMFDPRSPDLELQTALDNSPKSVQKDILNTVQDFTTRKSINFTNVRKIKTDLQSKSQLWDIENWSATYAYTEYNHRDFINEKSIQKTYKAALAYNYSRQAKSYTPFAKIIKKNTLALFRDFNYSLLPSVLNFRIDVDRMYSENTLRNNDPNNFIPVSTSFNKNFLMSRLYGISWNLTRSLQMDFNATNYSVIDEPDGAITPDKKEIIWQNLKKLGRTTDYGHNLNLTYNVPVNKIPGLDWLNVTTRYGTTFNWKSEPLATLNDPSINLGNSIQNTRVIQVNPSLNLNSFYNKFGFIRRINNNQEASKWSKALMSALTSVKNVGGAYTRTEGTFLPGYLPRTNAFGQDFDYGAPGWDFLFGSQGDIRGRAISNGWISNDPLLNQLYVTGLKEDLNLRGTVEPIKDLRIELTAMRSRNFNYSTTFKYVDASSSFENLNPITTGDYSISFFSLRTAFNKARPGSSTNLFRQFEANRAIISQRLGIQNPNSLGQSNGYADGYGKNSQDVVVASFLAAYSGKDATNIKLNNFPKIPVPNWRINYNGLSRIPFLSEIFNSIDLTHSYRSTYSVNGFSSLARYEISNGAVNVRDANDNFLPQYQFNQVTLFEQFVPLLGIDVRLKNNMTTNFEYRKSRTVSLSLANSQLALQTDEALVFGLGYRTAQFRFPFGLFKSLKMNNDMNFKLDFAINDRKTIIYRADVIDPEVSSGAKNITYRPSVDYVLNQRFNLRIFYDGNITKPYTSQSFNTSFSNFGVTLRFTIQ